MGVRGGAEYLRRLSERPAKVYLEGGRLESSVAEHPAFRGAVAGIAELYDIQIAEENVETMTATVDGEVVGASFVVPREEGDLVARRRASETWARRTNGFLGHSPDYLAAAVTALGAAEHYFAAAGEESAQRVSDYAAHVRRSDLLLAHTLVPPQVNRRVPQTAQGGGLVAARVVEERGGGIVVRGARMLATNGPIADELLVFPSSSLRRAPEDAPFAFAFAIPNDTPGLSYYCRAPLHRGGGGFDEPLASRYDEMDATAVFDDVYVPPERVFLLGNTDASNAFYSATGAAQLMAHQSLTRMLAKTEFYLGLAVSITDAIGISGFAHVQRDIAELIGMIEIERALIRASEVQGSLTEDGVFLPDWATLNAGRNWFPRHVAPRLTEIIRTLSASGLMALPSEADFRNLDERADLDLYFQGANISAEDRARLFKLALDASVSGFAGRETLYDYFFFGDPERMATALVAGYDTAPAVGRVTELLAR